MLNNKKSDIDGFEEVIDYGFDGEEPEELGEIKINEVAIHITKIGDEYVFAYPTETGESTRTIKANSKTNAVEKFKDYMDRLSKKVTDELKAQDRYHPTEQSPNFF